MCIYRRLKGDKEILERVVDAIDNNDMKSCYEEAKLVCGACGMPGHMRTNKICSEFLKNNDGGKKHILLAEPTVALAPSVRRAFGKLQFIQPCWLFGSLFLSFLLSFFF